MKKLDPVVRATILKDYKVLPGDERYQTWKNKHNKMFYNTKKKV